MALNTYAGLQASVATWLHRLDLSAVIPDLIALAEARIARDLRMRSQVVSVTVMTTAGNQGVTLPDGWLEFENVSLTGSPDRNLLYMAIENLDTKFPNNGNTGQPAYYSVEGAQLLLGPVPDASSYPISMLYYKRYDALAVTPSNFLLTNHPSVYLFATLAEAAPLMLQDSRATLWEQKYKKDIESVQAMDTQGQFSGSSLRVCRL